MIWKRVCCVFGCLEFLEMIFISSVGWICVVKCEIRMSWKMSLLWIVMLSSD